MPSLFQRAPQLNKVAACTQQADWQCPGGGSACVWTTNNSALSAAGARCHATSAIDGSAAATSGVFTEVFIEPASRIEFRFGINDSSSPDGLAVTARLWLLSEVNVGDGNTELIGEYACDLTITAGTLAMATGSKLIRSTGTSHWADTIAASPDRTYEGVEIVGSIADNAVAVVSVAIRGHRGYCLELTRNGSNADAATVLRRVV